MEDVALAFAVRTALVNDASVGATPVEVTVVDGVVTLTGHVPSVTDRDRVIALARAVPGVRRVVSELRVSEEAPATDVAETFRTSTITADPDDALPRLFAVGGGLSIPLTQSDTLDGLPTFWPVFRFGRVAGWHPVATLNWIRAELPPAAGTDAFGELRMLVVGGGLAYGFRAQRWMVSVGASAAASFNHVRLDPGPSLPESGGLPVAASNSPALVVGSSVWFDATRRLSLGVSGHYLFTRPGATWLEGSQFVERDLDADSIRLGFNAAWWLF
jgi:hypothetical protein